MLSPICIPAFVAGLTIPSFVSMSDRAIIKAPLVLSFIPTG